MARQRKSGAFRGSAFPGVRGQLMLFLCCITAITLGLLWVLITYGLQPMYNRNIRARLEKRLPPLWA